MKSAAQVDREIGEHRERERLRARIQRLIDKWQPILGVHVREWNIRTMKTYWASINEARGKITFSMKLAEMSPAFQEVTIVHELVHLLTHGHDQRFYELMDRHVPSWRRLHEKYSEPLTRES